MTIGKILTTIAAAYVLATSPSNAQALKVKTETDIQDNSRQGVPSQRIEAKAGDLFLKTDVKTNLSPADALDNIVTIGLNNIISNDDLAVNLQANNWGNFNNNYPNDPNITYLNAFASFKGATKFAAMIGRGFGKSTPRDFVYGSIEDAVLAQGLKGMLDVQIFSYAPMYDKSRKDVHAILALYGEHYSMFLGKQQRAQHIMGGINALENFGYFGWQKYDAETGAWLGRHRIAFGNVDKNLYNLPLQKQTARDMILPDFYYPHLNPSSTRGDYTLGIEFNGDKKSTTMRIIPGIRVPIIGSFGIGSETCWKNNQSATGMRLGYFNGFKVGDFAITTEVNESVRPDMKPAYDGFVTVNWAPQ